MGGTGVGAGMGLGAGIEVEEEEYGCRECGRIVCNGCAVVGGGLGEGRECLMCKTRTRMGTGTGTGTGNDVTRTGMEMQTGMGTEMGMEKRWVGGLGWLQVSII